MARIKDDFWKNRPLSVYVHIPFCEVKCGYCDFFSVPRGFEDFDLQKQYVEALIGEIQERLEPYVGRSIHSLFFGGGTPSLLDPSLLERILRALRSRVSWSSETEITLESNPKTVSYEKLRAFRSLGVNRLSIGVQSFQDRFLKILGRIHSGDEAKRTVEDARRAGFENVSCDLIFALPGQSFEEWKNDLETALALGTDHLSAYHLTIEQNTPFETLYAQGRLSLPPEEEGVRCLTWTRERLSASGGRLEPYEISNFSKPGRECVHNQNYWRYGEYLGLGAGAVSFIRNPPLPPFFKGGSGGIFGVRRHNVRNLRKYLEGSMNSTEGALRGRLHRALPVEGATRAPIIDFEDRIDGRTAMGEFCMLGLRTKEGIRSSDFQDVFGEPLNRVFSHQLERWSARNWLLDGPQGWTLTAPGLLFTDEVAASFLP